MSTSNPGENVQWPADLTPAEAELFGWLTCARDPGNLYWVIDP